MPAISAVIITYNESHNIGRCIRSLLPVADEVLVVDSHSKDDTVAIAQSLGARILLHPFEGYIEQKRYAIGQANHDFILSLDADEALSETLQEAVLQVKQNRQHDCYYVRRLSQFNGAWIRHGAWYPDKKMRLFDRNQYEVIGTNPHDKFVPTGAASAGLLAGDLLHYTNTDLESRVRTINSFSSVAARAFHENGKKGNLLRVLFKPGIRFISEYLLRLGFLDGLNGYLIARTSAQYVFYRESKLLELQQKLESSTIKSSQPN